MNYLIATAIILLVSSVWGWSLYVIQRRNNQRLNEAWRDYSDGWEKLAQARLQQIGSMSQTIADLSAASRPWPVEAIRLMARTAQIIPVKEGETVVVQQFQ